MLHELYQAIKSGDTNKAIEVINGDIFQESQPRFELHHCSALHEACREEQQEIVKALLQHMSYRFQVDALDVWNRTPLWWTCYVGQFELAKLLVQWGANIHDARLNELVYCDFIKDLREYQSDNKVDDSDEYWCAMINQAIRFGKIRKELIGKKQIYDNAAQAVALKKLFLSDKKDSSEIHDISEDDAVKYINNQFVSFEIKNKLFLHAFHWHKYQNGNYMFDNNKFEQIDHSCILNRNIEFVQSNNLPKDGLNSELINHVGLFDADH